MVQNKEFIDLANSIGRFIEYWGFKSIDGRVWALIYLSKSPISTPEIVKTLSVSKGLVSVAINELLQHELIITKDKIEHGAQTYCPNMNIPKAIQNVLKTRELNKILETETCIDALSKLSTKQLADLNVSSEKLKKLSIITKVNKQILKNVVSKKTETLDDWIKLLRRYKHFI